MWIVSKSLFCQLFLECYLANQDFYFKNYCFLFLKVLASFFVLVFSQSAWSLYCSVTWERINEENTSFKEIRESILQTLKGWVLHI